jgi:hypothetical protein
VVNGDVGDAIELGLGCWKNGWMAEFGEGGTVYTWKGWNRIGGIMNNILVRLACNDCESVSRFNFEEGVRWRVP